MTVQTEERKSIRGYLFNIIIYTHEKHRSDYFHTIVSAFIENYPCRVIFIQGEGESPFSVSELSKHGTCDRFSIKASKFQLKQVPFAILPLLIPDLPIYLVWGQNPTSDNEILPTMQKLATRFVYDSDCAKDLQEFSGKMLAKISELKIDFMDVGWAQIGGWRDVVAQTFNAPDKLVYLNQCNRIIIKYNQVQSPLILHASRQALYLQAWLAAQMGWEYSSIVTTEAGTAITYQTPNSAVEVMLNPQERPKLSQGRVFEMEFYGINELTTTLSLAEMQARIMVYLSTPQKCELPFSFPIPDLEKGLNAIKEIFYNRVSEHYQNMLLMLKQIPSKGL